MRTRSIIAISLGIYAAYLPAAIFVHRDYVASPRPAGQVVELLGRFWFDHPNHYAVRPYVFRAARFPDTSRFVVYENMTPLPRENFGAIWDKVPTENGSLVDSYAIRFRTSDGSDPRVNGRQYWIVGK
ncbi:hypothetical protein V1294_003893 [Bradyrhizobium sp. AZCC 1678]|uniref:Uncharacterized protein n=1 Tax=Bradyrhizobium algeriense TaxID=634784 RepID=A0ABU8BD90_9BRAD